MTPAIDPTAKLPKIGPYDLPTPEPESPLRPRKPYRFSTLCTTWRILHKRTSMVPALYRSTRLQPSRVLEENMTIAGVVIPLGLISISSAAHGFAVSSGMAALDVITRLLKPGDEVICGDDLYGGTNRLLTYLKTQSGVIVHHVNTTDADSIQPFVKAGKTAMVLLESPTNPLLKIVDIAKNAADVKTRAPEAIIVVDNTMMSPYVQRPLEHGTDIVYDSATKYLSGHHNLMAGVITCNRDHLAKTLAIRTDRQQATAMQVANMLDRLGFKVHYPGLPNHPGRDIHENTVEGGEDDLRRNSRDAQYLLTPFASRRGSHSGASSGGDDTNTIASPTATHIGDDSSIRSPSISWGRSTKGKSVNLEHGFSPDQDSQQGDSDPLPAGTTSRPYSKRGKGPSSSEDGEGGGPSRSSKNKDKAKDGEEESQLHLDPDQDKDFDVTPFRYKPNELASLVDPKSIEWLVELGGVAEVLRGLGTDVRRGLRAGAGSGKDGGNLEDRESIPSKGAGVGESQRHDRNQDSLKRERDRKSKPERKVLLSIAAVISLALGFFQDFGTPRPAGEPPVDWVEGVAIIVTSLIVVMVGLLNDWQKEHQFKSLNEKKEDRSVKVIRSGIERLVDVHQVVVGDICLLEPGEVIPCDGIFLEGHGVRCDESSATGESDAIKKVPFEECVKMKAGQASHTDCFVISGSKVIEGLPLAVTLALAFATKCMTAEKLLVRVLGSCETMANASIVCTDKTGTLTQNIMTVVAGSVGIHAKFVDKLKDNKARTNANSESDDKTRRHTQDFLIDQSCLNRVISPRLKQIFNEAITINSTAFEDRDQETRETVFVGSKTETALLKFAQDLGWEPFLGVRGDANVVQMIPFSSERKAMGVVVKLPKGGWRLYLKGASEILTGMCQRHVVVYKEGGEKKEGPVETLEIDDLARDNISQTIIFYANQTLRTIALCYRDFDTWPLRNAEHSADDDVEYDFLACDLTLIGIFGIEDPLRDGVREAVAGCHHAGVTVKMCTGDNVLTARSIAIQCGIYTAGGVIMEGPVFRNLSDQEKLEIVPRLQVLARSSPEDKKILVEKLKELGEVVGVTGDGTNDGAALKTTHVAFSMGIAGTEVAKEASDIILMDDNFSSIVKAIMWGRCVNDAVCKFLQFQISTNITAVVITFVSAVASTQEASVLSAVQLLWINIIMDTFAALALATDPASPALLDRQPDKKMAPPSSDTWTVVFNIFVSAQIFDSVNSRRLDNKFNIFEGVLSNYYFIKIILLGISSSRSSPIVPIVIVFIGGAAFQVTRIGAREWGILIALGVVSIPLSALVHLIPNGPIERFFIKVHLLPNREVLPTKNVQWNPAIDLVCDNLGTFANVRGGHLRGSSFVAKSCKARMEEGQFVANPSWL
ncbi:hypothetical protein JAAARDRAFT_686421 [Jaapia argillacea MUCL 33604]|uniref:Calcium-transporting ATPase 2 n=1 Tax=Jaapia argillacea MUCL 33604 TaxID=933084 RepID=A0A067P5H7_9AGAM|nr:hypothetical protein JAAARDRAFT_686421 [Jaapia argillacea MUCL 33604]